MSGVQGRFLAHFAKFVSTARGDRGLAHFRATTFAVQDLFSGGSPGMLLMDATHVCVAVPVSQEA